MTRPLDIVCVGGGPGGLYFALLMKKADPSHRIRVIERNRPDDTFGFGVVFSDATMVGIAEADQEAYQEIAKELVHWDDIDVHYRGTLMRSTGHGFSGISRQTLLRVLQEQAASAGIDVRFESEVSSLDEFAGADLVVAADGANSSVRRLLADHLSVAIDVRPNRFVWLGTSKPFPRSRSTSSATSTGSGAFTPTNTSLAGPPSSSNAATRPGAPPASIGRARTKAPLFSSASSLRSSQAIRSSPIAASGVSSPPS
jgi:2-polyprenyl-6-methoxyphenol hydroxylase-like FAD-dependent oxidoreductase